MWVFLFSFCLQMCVTSPYIFLYNNFARILYVVYSNFIRHFFYSLGNLIQIINPVILKCLLYLQVQSSKTKSFFMRILLSVRWSSLYTIQFLHLCCYIYMLWFYGDCRLHNVFKCNDKKKPNSFVLSTMIPPLHSWYQLIESPVFLAWLTIHHKGIINFIDLCN